MGQGQEGTWLSGANHREARVHMEDPNGSERVAEALVGISTGVFQPERQIVLVCIGTDRSIGDALGPLVGSLLSEHGDWPFHILGTLDQPVHAGNLADTVSRLEQEFQAPMVVAVDACLGRSESVGYVTVGRGPLRPGAGVNKHLPPLGHVHVTGVVNVGGFMEYFVLQNTRLNLVMRMAKMVASGIGQGLSTLVRSVRS